MPAKSQQRVTEPAPASSKAVAAPMHDAAPAAPASVRPWTSPEGAAREPLQFADPRLQHPNGGRAATALLRSAQRYQGNAWLAQAGLLRAPVAGGRAVDAAAAEAAQRDASPGEALPPEAQREHGERCGKSFADVRIHTDHRAAELAAGLRANAFTHGSHIYFAQGRWAPSTGEGRRLLGHELAHVAQSSGDAAAGGGSSSVEELELEARQAGKAAVADRPVTIAGRASFPAPLLRDGDASGPAVATPANAGQFRFAFYRSAHPLAPYTALRRASPETWASFELAARALTLAAQLAPSGEGQPAAAAPAAELPTASVPVSLLVLPEIPPFIAADLRTRLWPVVSSELGNPDEAAAVLLDEIVSRWAEQNRKLVDGQVNIRLIPPEETMASQVLAFDIDGKAIDSTDGSLPLIALDLLGSNNIEEITQEVGEEATVIATAGDLLVASKAMVDAETAFWAEVRNNPDAVSLDEVRQHYALFSAGPVEAPVETPAEEPLGMKLSSFNRDHPECREELVPTVGQVAELSYQVADDYADYLDYHDALVQSPEMFTQREGLDQLKEVAERLWEEDEGILASMIAIDLYRQKLMGEGMYFVENTATFGYPETRHAGVQAFKRGKISYHQLEELSEAAAARGAAVALVSVALTLATAGLAGPVLGTAASLGQKMLFYGVAGAVTTMATETAGSEITAAKGFENPMQQAIWEQGRRTPGQILAAGAIGFGIGAASVPASLALGKLAAWLRSVVKPVPAMGSSMVPAGSAAAAKAPTPPPGWVAEQVTPDIVRYTHPQVPGEVMVTATDISYQIPAGTGMKVQWWRQLGAPAEGVALPELPAAAGAPELPSPATRPAPQSGPPLLPSGPSRPPGPPRPPLLPSGPSRPTLPALPGPHPPLAQPPRVGGSTSAARVTPGSSAAGVEASEEVVDPSHVGLQRLLADYGITDPTAQRFVIRLVGVEYSKNRGQGLTPAVRRVRTQLKKYAETARQSGKTTEAVVLDVASRGFFTSQARPEILAAADVLQERGILASHGWKITRDPGLFKGVVGEWLAAPEVQRNLPPDRSVLSNVHFYGNLYNDAAMTSPRLDPDTGRPRLGIDTGSELDYLTVRESGGAFEYFTVSNVKTVASGGAGAAAKQNQQAIKLLQAHETGMVVEITTNNGEQVFARVIKIKAVDMRTGAEIDLTGKLRPAASGVTQVTIGPARGSGYTQTLPFTSDEIDMLVNVLRERLPTRAPAH